MPKPTLWAWLMNAAQKEAERKALRHIPARDTRRHPLASECQQKPWPRVFPAPRMLLKERKVECAFFLLNHAKLRGNVRKGLSLAHLDEAAFIAYQEDTTFRSSFVCEGCYGALDSSDGTGTILGNALWHCWGIPWQQGTQIHGGKL